MREQKSPFRKENLQKEHCIDPELRKMYRERITRLIHGIHEKNIDTLVFLDRSARPFAWLFREMWKSIHPNEPVPKITFMNIGTENAIQIKGRGFDYNIPFDAEKRSSVSERDEWIVLNTQSPHQKNILVIDEMLSTGKSLLCAMRIVQSSNKYEKIYGAGLFSATKGGVNDDKKLVPWLREPGMVGVLELPHSLPFSGGITQENINRIQEHLTRCIDEEVENIQKTFTKIQRTLAECMTAFIANEIEVKNLQEGQKKLQNFVLMNPYKDPTYDHLYDDIRVPLIEEISFVKRFLTEYATVRILSQAENQLMMPYAKTVEKLRSLQKLKKEDYGDLKKLHDRHIALRKEIKRIAGER